MDGGGPSSLEFLHTPVGPNTPLAVFLPTHLSILIDGQAQQIPGGIGVVPGDVLPVHTFDTSGQVIFESYQTHTFYLQDFFLTWGKTFSTDQVLDSHVDATHPLSMTVNGLATNDFGSRVIQANDDIVIRYGSSSLLDTSRDNSVPELTGDQSGQSSPPLQASGTNGLPAVLDPNNNTPPPTNPDPTVPGPFAVTKQEFNFGNTAFQPSDFGALPGSPRVELAASIIAPTNLNDPAFGGRPLPVLVLLHGRHSTLYIPGNPTGFLGWPPSGPFQSIPSFEGYDYFSNIMASQGYIVVSISANGINAQDNNVFDLGALARAQLMQRHLDILRDLNLTGTVTGLPGGPQTPFGTRYVGKIDLQNIGIMGHSRGGEGVVREFILNQSLGSPYGIKAVFALAPVDFTRPVINNVPLGVLLPYTDGDVSDLQGVHFYDDARYNVAGDLSPKHTFLVFGACHNFYNTIWSPGGFPAGTDDDALDFAGIPIFFQGQQIRLTQDQERATGEVIMGAFFRAYVPNYLGAAAAKAFLPFLKGDMPPPPSAQTTGIFSSYQAPGTSQFRRDVNRLLTLGNMTTNTLGGAVVTGGLTNYIIYGGDAPEQAFIQPGEPSGRFPHTVPSARSNKRGLSQLDLSWTNTLNAFYENDLPAGSRDESGYYALEFRANVNWTDPKDKTNVPSDFTVTLTDGAGNTASTQVSTWARALFYPPLTGVQPSLLPKDFLDTVRIPLTAFAGVNLTDVRSITFNFDQRSNGNLLLTDLAFVDPANLYAGPFVTSLTPPSNIGPVSSVDVGFNTSIDATSFNTSAVILTGPAGPIPITGVDVVPGTSNSHFTVSFPTQGLVGTYTITVGPHIRDLAGHEMDQNVNGITGETPGDLFVGTFALHGPRIIASTPNGIATAPVSTITVTFNTAMDPSTFTMDKIASFTGPNGAIPISNVSVDPTSGNTVFTISFPAQSAQGNYTMVIGPNIRDTFGNQMDQNDNLIPGEIPGDQFVATFKFPVTYTAQVTDFQNINIFGQAGTQTVVFSSGLVTADDDYGIINIGSNSFNFYGQSYNQLFVGSNGLITLGGNNQPGTDFAPTNLVNFPPFATIGVYWTDLFKSGNEPMIVWRINGNQLIIEWYRVTTFDPSPVMTFEALLTLNTGASPGDIICNYTSVTGTGDGPEGLGVTVGIKDVGTGSAVSPTLIEDGTFFSSTGDPRVQTGRAVKFSSP
jgi:hypothetical protein